MTNTKINYIESKVIIVLKKINDNFKAYYKKSKKHVTLL